MHLIKGKAYFHLPFVRNTQYYLERRFMLELVYPLLKNTFNCSWKFSETRMFLLSLFMVCSQYYTISSTSF